MSLNETDWHADVYQGLRACLAQAKPGDVAVFDADGTLWADDLGDDFLQWLIAKEHLLSPPEGDIFADYQARCKRDKTQGYLYAAQLMAGLSETEVKSLSTQYFEAEYRQRIFPAMQALVQSLQEADVSVWAVSATNQWSAEVGVSYLGIPAHQVIGMRVQVRDGSLTDTPDPPLNNDVGKVENIQNEIGQIPILAGGNSMSDKPMLNYSQQRLVINPDPELGQIAQDRQWLVQRF